VIGADPVIEYELPLEEKDTELEFEPVFDKELVNEFRRFSAALLLFRFVLLTGAVIKFIVNGADE